MLASLRTARGALALAVALTPAFMPAALAKTPTAEAAATLAAYAEELLDEQGVKKDGPGLTLLVAQGDQLLYQGARGMASIELGVPLQADHRMRLGSITKQFAAAALLKLVDEGKASLDDPLSKFLPDYPNGQAITLTQLLNHSSGVKSYTGIAGYMRNSIRQQLSTAELIQVFKDQPVDFAPGTQYRYNNSGYVLVGAVVEAISGKPWHEALDAALLKPQRVDVRYPGETTLVPGMVQGYSRSEKDGVGAATAISMTQPHAAGALVSNVQALWRWNQALHGGQLLQPATYQRMITPEGQAANSQYGFGIATSQLRGQPMLQHGGGINGFRTVLMYQPALQLTVALLANSDGPSFDLDLIARKLGAKALGKPYPAIRPVKLEPQALQAFEGVYAIEGKGSRTLRLQDGVLTSTRSGSQAFDLIPLGKDRFAFEKSLAQMQIERDGKGQVVAVSFVADGDGEGERWPRTGDVSPRKNLALSEAERSVLLGEYSGSGLKLTVFVDEQGQLSTLVPGQSPVRIRANSPREFWAVDVDATLTFSAEPGKAQSVTLQQGPNRLQLKRL